MNLSYLKKLAETGESPDRLIALSLLNNTYPLEELIDIAEIPRVRHYRNEVQIHVINNIKNGHCAEDCGYCAQRSSGTEDIAAYSGKTEEEILEEAKDAFQSGAFRYCLVTSGRGPTMQNIHKYASLIRKIKEKFPMEICLSAGIVNNPQMAQILKEAGLNRYNHNLNTSEENYPAISKTHSYSDRLDTLKNLTGAGISICSGIIAGLGETDEGIVDLAFRLKSYEVASIPVNFFLPVPGHIIKAEPVTYERAMRILIVFRMINQNAEIRLAAGREHYFGEKQPDALRVANSLFVSGYLNVKGSDAISTLEMIYGNGYSVDTKNSDLPHELEKLQEKNKDIIHKSSATIKLKTFSDLRPHTQK